MSEADRIAEEMMINDPLNKWNKHQNKVEGMKALELSGFVYTVHNNGVHVIIEDTVNYYPTTGKFTVDGHTYAPECNNTEYVRKNVNMMIDMLSQCDDQPGNHKEFREEWFNKYISGELE